MKNSIKFEQITLNGIKIKIFKEKVQIFNDSSTPFEEFKPTVDRLMQYMIDEAFIEKKAKHRVEVITPEKTTN